MALPPVIVDFRVEGIQNVERAFRTVADASVRAETNRTRSAEKGTRDRERLEAKAAKDKEKAINEMGKRVDKSLANETKLVEKAEREKQRQVDTSARYMARVRENSATMAGNLARRQADAEIREMKRAVDARVRFAKTIGGAGGRSISGIAGGALALGGTALALGGGFAIGNAVSSRMQAERTAALLVNQVTVGSAAPQGANVNSILSQASGLSKITGTSQDTLVGSALEYSRKAKGGDFGGAMANMSFFAKMAKVTGADINEIAGAAGTLQSQNQELAKDPKAMQQMLLDVYAQGKQGSMSMVDVAKQIGVLGSTRSAYAGDAATNQRKLLALGQLAAPEGTVDEAGTFIKDIAMRAGEKRFSTKSEVGLEQMGVKYDKYGRMESPEQMIDAVMKFNKGDITKIEKTFGARGKALFGALQPAFAAAGGGDAGIAAINKQMATVTGATMSPEQMQSQFAQTMSTSSEKFEKAVTTIQDLLMDKLAPHLEAFANKLPEFMPKIERLIDGADKLATWFLDNPLLHAGELILAKIGADIGRAALGEAIKAAIVRAIAGQAAGSATGSAVTALTGGGAGAAGAGGAGGGGALGAAGGVGAVGAVAALAVGGALFGTYMQNDAGQNAADAKALFASNPAAYAREVAARKQQNAGLDPNSREYAANLAYINGSGGTGGAFNMTPEQKAVMERGAKNPESMQMGNAQGAGKGGGTSIDTLIPGFTAAITKATVDGIREGNKTSATKGDPNHPARNSPMSAGPRGGTQ